MTTTYESLAQKIKDKSIHVGIIGLGYVGLPLAMSFCRGGVRVTGFDVDERKIPLLLAGDSYIDAVPSDQLKQHVQTGLMKPTSDFAHLSDVDAIIICVPTPLSAQREPDLSYVMNSVETIAQHPLAGKIIILESTTYPGTVADEMRPVLATYGFVENEDYFLAFSPEREDPGNKTFHTTNIPKIVGADHEKALDLSVNLYKLALESVVPVSSTKAAEASKITENIFRAVNIALVNELKVIYDAMGIDVWEVINAAATKPFGYMPFYPGPGLGGHCIPIDPFYLTWKAREFEHNTRFIELAGEINRAMPSYVVGKTLEALSEHRGKAVKGANILVLGVAYKKNVNDLRESPAFAVIRKLTQLGATVSYYDPHVPVVTPMREHPEIIGMESIEWNGHNFSQHDAVVVITDHDNVDYAHIGAHAPLVVDTRNVFARHTVPAVVVKA